MKKLIAALFILLWPGLIYAGTESQNLTDYSASIATTHYAMVTKKPGTGIATIASLFGLYFTFGIPSQYQLLQYNGTKWAPVSAINLSKILTGTLWCDSADTTKCIQLVLSGISGSTTRNVTFPDAAGTVMYTSQKFTTCSTIKDPTADSDHQVFRAGVAMTITNAHCLATGGTSLTGSFQECDANGANCAGIDGATTMTCTAGSNVNDDGSLSNPSIDAGDYVKWVTASVDGTQTEVIVCFDYTLP